MKTMKKLASAALALVMALCLTVPAFATTIEINNPVTAGEDGRETYTAYKIFDVVIGGNDQTDSNAPHSYTIKDNSPFYPAISTATTIFELEAAKTETVGEGDQAETVTTYNVKLVGENKTATAVALAKILSAVENKGTPAATTNTANNEGIYTLDLDAAGAGYYLITSTLGSNMIVDTVGAGQTLRINAKNDYPTLTKKVVTGTKEETVEGSEEKVIVDVKEESTTASYGETVTFAIDVVIPASAVGEIIVHDTMDSNLTFGELLTTSGVTKRDATEAEDADKCSFEFVVPVPENNENGTTVTIKYTATLQTTANPGDAIVNKAHLTYSNYTSKPDDATVYTYSFDIVKTTSEQTGYQPLTGAQFELYDTKTAGSKINLVKIDDGTYRIATPAEAAAEGFTSAIIEAGRVTVKGLGAGTYYLEEIKAPDGYNKLKERRDVIIANANLDATVTSEEKTEGEGENQTTKIVYTVAGGVHVENLTGAELPETGGIGTTIFYIVGGLLAVGAGVLLVTKKKMGADDE